MRVSLSFYGYGIVFKGGDEASLSKIKLLQAYVDSMLSLFN